MKEVESYEPTPAEAKLLRVLLDPEFATASMKEKIQAAGISHQKYYDCFKKPGFVKYLEGVSLELIKNDVAPLIHTGIKHAKAGNFQYWKALMEMTGLYVDKVEITGSVTLEQALREMEEK